ncbi:protein of unknown function [Cnuella takakiae]|uniref:Uncharacterized protein n=1 Tax=Cnuella takakiae TaxID=1302690 RepID=A0A1M5C290_9BACT|nr:DUF4105 domain-containing protein [Cnuella takakiae]OLY93598.1 hypothetical protein BUE76_18255 [Cnuella takakiae]SHF48888.1 protein of unknown function [Cnuella takakiae]
MIRFLLAIVFLFVAPASFAQSDSCGLRITLLTCNPGEELYSTFGHTAIRVQHGPSGTDEVYNYGMFEFAPDFYLKFIRGKLLYSLTIETYPDFLYTYQYESRSVVEQEVLLGCSQKQNLWAALRENARPENRNYRYDFLFDNCTTRARDMIARYAGKGLQWRNILPAESPTFREMLHTYLDGGGQYWSKLGIDLLLGARLDRTVSNQQAMFLPDYLLKGVDSARLNGQRLVSPPRPILQLPSPIKGASALQPMVVLSILLLIVGALSFLPQTRALLKIFDRLFFLLLGLAGFLLLFMWLGTDHKVCRDNLNLLWALPTHAVAAWYTGRNTDRTLTYFRMVCWGMVALVGAWFFMPQALNPALLPLVALVALRSWRLSQPNAYAHKKY